MTKKQPAKVIEGLFNVGQHVVYPAHGVGRVTGVETQQVAGMKLEVFVVAFEQDKLILRVPVAKAASSGMRALASTRIVGDALKTLGGRARIKRTMWSRRAQEYEAKINSGNLIQIAEVVRDLPRAGDQPAQAFPRLLYKSQACDEQRRMNLRGGQRTRKRNGS